MGSDNEAITGRTVRHLGTKEVNLGVRACCGHWIESMGKKHAGGGLQESSGFQGQAQGCRWPGIPRDVLLEIISGI